MKLSTATYWGLLASLALRLCLSSALLDSFYPYAAEGGMWFQKIHPGTFLVVLVMGLVMAQRGVSRFVSEQWRNRPEGLIFMLVACLAIATNAVRFGAGGLAYMVDTFLAAGIMVMLLKYLTDSQKRGILLFVIGFIAVNSVMAIAELVGGFNLLVIAQTFGFHRATAFLGHPLTNGLITASLLVPLLVTRLSAYWKVPLLTLFLLSLFAFGARGATSGALICLSAYLLALPFTGRESFKARSGYIVLAVTCVVVVLVGFSLVLTTSLGAGISERMTLDVSAESRFDSLTLLRIVGWKSLMLGMDQQTYLSMLGLGGTVEVVENFWVVLLIQFGLPLFLLFVWAFLKFLRSAGRSGGWRHALAILGFLLIASTNNSLASKTPALLVFVVALVTCGSVSSSKSTPLRDRLMAT